MQPSLSDDGRYVTAFVLPDERIAVWSTETYERIDDGTLVGSARIVGDLLAVRGRAGFALHDLPDLTPVGPPIVHELGGLILIEPDYDEVHQRLAVSQSGTVAVYDLTTGAQLGRPLPYHPLRIQFTEDGNRLMVPSRDRVSVWNYDTATWPDLACEMAGRNLTREEWEQVGPRTIDYRPTCDQFPIEQ